MNNDQKINQNSGCNEYYTPSRFIESARKVMGGITLDPASCAIANKTVKADTFYTKEDNGLILPWSGKVWMNHPFSKGELACKKYKSEALKGQYQCKKDACKKRGYHIDQDLPGNEDWISKLINSYHAGDVEQSMNISFASTSEDWFIPLLDYPQCFISKRVNYYNAEGKEVKGAPKGSVITYLGDDYLSFKREFSQYGKVK